MYITVPPSPQQSIYSSSTGCNLFIHSNIAHLASHLAYAERRPPKRAAAEPLVNILPSYWSALLSQRSRADFFAISPRLDIISPRNLRVAAALSCEGPVRVSFAIGMAAAAR